MSAYTIPSRSCRTGRHASVSFKCLHARISFLLALFVLLAPAPTAADEAVCRPGKYIGSSEIELAVCVLVATELGLEEGMGDVGLDLELAMESLSAPYGFDCAKNITDESGHGYCHVDCSSAVGEGETVNLVLDYPIAVNDYSLRDEKVIDGSLDEPSFRLDGCRLRGRHEADGTPTLKLVLIHNGDITSRAANFHPVSFQ